jgi:PIN domain nuclease of toxin-antitoxin system
VRFLLDTSILLWAAFEDPKLSPDARAHLTEAGVKRYFSVASLWETAIKTSLGRSDFCVDVKRLRRLALDNGYEELNITIDHLETLMGLANIHKDPFDRLLIAQAKTEGMTLLTSDSIMATYGGDILQVRSL